MTNTDFQRILTICLYHVAKDSDETVDVILNYYELLYTIVPFSI